MFLIESRHVCSVSRSDIIRHLLSATTKISRALNNRISLCKDKSIDHMTKNIKKQESIILLNIRGFFIITENWKIYFQSLVSIWNAISFARLSACLRNATSLIFPTSSSMLNILVPFMSRSPDHFITLSPYLPLVLQKLRTSVHGLRLFA